MILELNAIDTYYGDAQALYGVSLAVGEGEVVSLLGANGAGKTTTLRSILSLTPPRIGEIRFGGAEITRRPTHEIARAGVGWVPDDRRIFPSLTVERNLAIARKKTCYRQWSLGEMFEIFSPLEYLMSRECENLSGGEMQRVAIARALVHQPAIILADEPTGNLDSENGVKILELMKKISVEFQTTLVVATHNPKIADYGNVHFEIRDGKLTRKE